MRRNKRFLTGRNGPDSLSMALSLVSCIFLVIALFAGGIVSTVLWLLALLFLAFNYFRIFSRNTARRSAENAWFCNLFRPVTAFFRRQKTKRQQKNLYCFFKCPNCSTVLRVPKGKGRLRITCKNCQHVFERTT